MRLYLYNRNLNPLVRLLLARPVPLASSWNRLLNSQNPTQKLLRRQQYTPDSVAQESHRDRDRGDGRIQEVVVRGCDDDGQDEQRVQDPHQNEHDHLRRRLPTGRALPLQQLQQS